MKMPTMYTPTGRNVFFADYVYNINVYYKPFMGN